jgi:hypothetical protein
MLQTILDMTDGQEIPLCSHQCHLTTTERDTKCTTFLTSIHEEPASDLAIKTVNYDSRPSLFALVLSYEYWGTTSNYNTATSHFFSGVTVLCVPWLPNYPSLPPSHHFYSPKILQFIIQPLEFWSFLFFLLSSSLHSELSFIFPICHIPFSLSCIFRDLYTPIFIFLTVDKKTKDSRLNGSKHYPNPFST